MKANLYIDFENTGQSWDYDFVIEQIMEFFDFDCELTVYGYFRWKDCAIQKKEWYQNKGMIVRDIEELGCGIKVKNLADICIGIDVAEHVRCDVASAIMIFSRDNHFKPIIEHCSSKGIRAVQCSRHPGDKNILKKENMLILRPKRVGTLQENVWLKIFNQSRRNIEKEPFQLAEKIIEACCEKPYGKKLFETRGIKVSELIAVISCYKPRFTLKSIGYKNKKDFAKALSYNKTYRALQQGSEYVLRDGCMEEESGAETFLEPIKPYNFEDIAYYEAAVGLPKNFNLEELKSVINSISKLDNLGRIIEYYPFLKKSDMVERQEEKIVVCRRNYFRKAVLAYIEVQLKSSGVELPREVYERLF